MQGITASTPCTWTAAQADAHYGVAAEKISAIVRRAGSSRESHQQLLHGGVRSSLLLLDRCGAAGSRADSSDCLRGSMILLGHG